MHIVHNCNGSNIKVEFEPKKIDEQQSRAWSSNTYLEYSNGQNIAIPKMSDDKIVLGYTYDGLPFQMVVDGMFGCDREKVFAFIDESVVPLIDDYARALSLWTNDPDKITKNFIEELRRIRPELMGVEFTLSLAVTYERGGLLQCSGFGIGDTAIVLKRSNGVIDQLVTNNQVNGFKDAFDDTTAGLPIDNLLERNTLFTTVLEEGEELFGYTYVEDDLEKEQEKVIIKPEGADGTKEPVEIIKKGLTISSLANTTLYDHILKENNDYLEKRKKDKISGGDDATFGHIMVPTAALREKLKYASLYELERLLQERVDDKLKEKVQAVYEAAKVLIDRGEKVDSVLQQVEMTIQLLNSSPGETRNKLLKTYMKKAEEYNQQASRYEKILGMAMMALGNAIYGLGVGLTMLSVRHLGSYLQSQGQAIHSAGFGLFDNQKQKEFAEAMKMFKEEQENEQTEEKPHNGVPGNN